LPGFVSMDQPACVGRVERARDLRDDRRRALAAECSVRADDSLQIGALDVPHRDVQGAVDLVGIEDRDDVRVIDRGGELGFTKEPVPEPLAPRELGRQQLERNPASQTDVLGKVDGAHASPADDALDPVAAELRPDTCVLDHRSWF